MTKTAPAKDWSQATRRWHPEAKAIGALSLLLAAAFFLGGSARGDVASLMVLRPFAAMLVGFGLWQLQLAQVQQHKLLLALALACVALPLLQLVPLPYAVWSDLPGRQQVVEIDQVAGLGKIARPLSLVPEATLNALLSLIVPLAALILGIQLDRKARERLLPIVLGLVGVSALLAVLQTLGGPDGALYLYDISNRGSPIGLLANRNHQAVLLAMALPMLALLATKPRKISLFRMVGCSAGLLTLVPLILTTGSRAGTIIGLLALLSIFWITPATELHPAGGSSLVSKRARNWSAAGKIGVISLVPALVGLTIYMERAEAWDRLQSVFHDDDLRFRILPTVAEMFVKYWPVGTGLGSFEKVFQANEPDALLSPVYMNHAHNDWLEVSLTGGLPSIGLLAAGAGIVAVSLARQFLARRSRSAPDRLARLGLIVIVLLGIASLSDYPLRTPLLETVFVVALLWASCPLPQNETWTATLENHCKNGLK